MSDLATLPKAHLHLHLEGAMRPSTLDELAAAAGVAVPPVTSASDFGAFIALYGAACEVLRGPDELFRLFREVAEDAAAAGAVWVEPHVDTTLHLRLGSHEEVFELFLAAAAEAERATGVGVGLLMSADRTLDPAIAVTQARLAASKAGEGVVAFGLANDEVGHPAETYAEAFAIARDAGLIRRRPHAGELAGPESVRGASDWLQPQRLGHGVRAVEDPPLVERLAAEDICCDVCPTSNLTLKLAPSIQEHPVRALLAAGVPVTLNADDPLMFRSGLADEYRLVADGLSLSDEAMAAIARTSIDRSGMPESAKSAARAAITTWLS